MEIILIRYCYSRWGVMGALYIDGLCICHTCEHPDKHLSVGKYDVNLKGEKLFILLKSADRCNKSDKSITLTIKDRKKNVYEIL